MEKENACKNRIQDELKGRLEEIKEASTNEKAREEFDENILAFSKRNIVYRIELSYGGPQDYIDIYVDPEEYEIERIIYYFLDWYDGTHLELEGEEFKLVKNYFSELIYCYK